VGGTASAVLCGYGAASFGGVPAVTGTAISIFSGGGTAVGTGFSGPDETGGDAASSPGCGCGFVFVFCSMFWCFFVGAVFVCDHAGMLNPAMAVARGARRLPDPFAKFTFWESSVPVGTKVWLQGAFHPENFQTTFICGYFDQSFV